MWFSLHTITFNYPLNPSESDKANYKIFFDNFKHVIPCSVCKKNYIRHLKEHPIDNYLSCRKKLVYWLIDLHNLVNVETGKKIVDYNVVLNKYEKIYKKKIDLTTETSSSCDNNNNKNKILFSKNNIIVFLIIALIILSMYVYVIKKRCKK
jgi:hypothetical protein